MQLSILNFVWHDTVIQETAVLTLATTTLLLLISAVDRPIPVRWLAAGGMLAVDVLIKANLALFAASAVLWTLFSSADGLAANVRRSLWMATGLLVVLSPWLIRTWLIAGEPVIYSNSGRSLWTANNPLTFDYFPTRSIDDSTAAAESALTPEQRLTLRALETKDPQGMMVSHWYWNKRIEFIRTNPGLTFARDLRKVGVAFSPIFSPRKARLEQLIYLMSYLPILLLAPVGFWIERAKFRKIGYLLTMIGSFALGSAVFWAHTSHRMYVEPCLIISASSVVAQALRASHKSSL